MCPRARARRKYNSSFSGYSSINSVKAAIGDYLDAPRTLSLYLQEDGKKEVTVCVPVRFFSATNALKRLAVLKGRLPALQADLKAVETRGQDTSYPRVTATVLENFIGYAE